MKTARMLTAVSLTLLWAAFSSCGNASAGPSRAKVEIKIATLAPEGSTWMNTMQELDAEIRRETSGEVGLRFYPGGIQGDEQVVLRKIRSGQLHGGGFTGVGLGEIAPSLRVMELPFLFHDEDEVQAVHAAMDSLFEDTLHSGGYTLLGWAEVGFVYLYSKEPVTTTEELRNQKVWLWEGDPLAEAFLKEAGVSPVPLAVTDVLTSLQTGLLTTVYITPLANIALQWFTKLSYTTDLPITFSIGAVVVTNEAFDRIPAARQATVRQLCQTYFAKLAAATTADNRKSMEVMAEQGIRSVTPSPAAITSFRQIGERVRTDLAGKLYDQETLSRVLRVLEAHRTEHPATAVPSGSSAR